ncbi:CHRD domain-containing protein [Rubrivivax albus]|uniref:CHRD domain-containing protein n=1 Tax=Rubrivivax albus TaxID=2499835 RepID=A0A3S2U4P8_9BURK|nr:CHRD domain-containing protein [Rubrivivax albus]RVT53533.1 CHRD domain-containing protein [Rubrivivax albus]
MLPLLTRTAAIAALLAAGPALAHTVVYEALLDGPSDAPPVASPGTGWARVTLDDHDFTMRVEASFADLVGNVTASHIHCCTAAAGSGTAGVATPVPTFPGFPSGVNAGSYDMSFDLTQASSWNPAYINANGGTTAGAFAALATGLADGKAYLNIHSSFAPGGEIRGFLAPVPEPATVAMMLAGLGLLAARQRRA